MQTSDSLVIVFIVCLVLVGCGASSSTNPTSAIPSVLEAPNDLLSVTTSPNPLILNLDSAQANLTSIGKFASGPDQVLNNANDGLLYEVTGNPGVVSVDMTTGVVAVAAQGSTEITASTGSQSDVVAVQVDFGTAGNLAPQLNNKTSLLGLGQVGSPAVLAFPEATVADDQANFQGGILTVEAVGTGNQDIVITLPAAPAIGQVLNNGTEKVIVNLDNFASSVSLQAVLRNLTLAANSDGRGQLLVSLQDGQGQTSTTTRDFMAGLFFVAAPGSPFSAAATSVSSVATGDSNGDGHLDLISANVITSDLSLLLGDGTGNFSPANDSPFAVGSIPAAVALADLNGDGELDVVSANGGSDSVSVLLGSGAGNFVEVLGSPFPVGVQPNSIALNDLNGDGRVDLVSANLRSDDLSIFLGDGAGGFTEAANSPFAIGVIPRSVTTEDVNRDGILDFISPIFGLASVAVSLGDGVGNFSLPTNSGIGGAPQHAAVGDVNGDGNPDVVAVRIFGSDAVVLLGDGTGSFVVTGSSLSVGNFPNFVVLEDLSGDGDLDMVVSNQFAGTLRVFEGDGTGAFVEVTSSPIDLGAQQNSVAIADLNDDGNPDIISGGLLGTSVLLQVGP